MSFKERIFVTKGELKLEIGSLDDLWGEATLPYCVKHKIARFVNELEPVTTAYGWKWGWTYELR